MGRTFVEYFTQLFKSSQVKVSTKLIEAIQVKVKDRMNTLLMQDFHAHDVEKALKQMHPLKALGPDASPKFHETHIVLIPKAKNSKRVTDYRPISLCNMAYKLASKVVANRLNELMNHINRKKKGRNGEMSLKLDMSKAYDWVVWGCLQQIMGEWENSANAPSLWESSDQQLNRSKTSLFFSPNTDHDTKEAIKAMFRAQVIKPHESYLGLPSLVGKSKQNMFAQLKERVVNKFTGWKEKLLSNSRKKVLIKAVAQAVPFYTTSCFKLPTTLCEELTRMVRHFWWGQVKDEKKLAWQSWEKMCLPKERGSMGFRDLRLFNLALLAKQGWQLQMNSSSLFYRVYKANTSQDVILWKPVWGVSHHMHGGASW
ncbi:hypothetical protein SO802_033718 [Lithocarpus litseifolius]|uniref:Reverse transcriptase n=1 Tax=Lithocarpus litseifolius TaxID=425828 RepID=A0AAW2BFH7_9ROSI